MTWTSGVTIGKGLTINGAGTSRIIARDNGTTSVTIGTGSKSFTIINYAPRFSSASITVGQTLQIFNLGASTNWMQGTVTSWNAGTGALVMSITSTNGSGSYTKWRVRTVPTTFTSIVQSIPGSTQVPLFTINQDTTASVYIGFMQFPVATTRQTVFQINNANTADTGYKTFIHDWWIQTDPSVGTPGGAGTNPIEAATNQFVLYNFSAESITYEQAAFAIPDITINRPNPWQVTDKWGAADTGGAQNSYVEYGSWHAMGSSCDDTGGGMLVCRDSVYDNSAMSTHGADTGYGLGNRYMDIYNNTWWFDSNGELPLAYWAYYRGGTTYFHDNIIPQASGSYSPPDITLQIQNLRRDAGPDPCWGAGYASPSGQNYFSPRQIGYGNVTGAGTTSYTGVSPNPVFTVSGSSDSVSYVGDLDPIYIYNNQRSVGGGATALIVSVSDYSPTTGCTNFDTVANYIQLGREYYNTPTLAKPGYSPFTDPFPGTVPTVQLTPSSENFGTVNTGSSSSPITFTVANNSVATMNSISPTTTGGNSGDFTITNSGAGSCSAAGGTLTTTASCTFTVTFTPLATGSRSTALSVSYTGGDSASPQTAALSGTGNTTGAPVFSVSPAPYNFLSAATGSSTAQNTFTLTNTGTASGTVSTIAFSGTNSTDFSQTDTCGTLPATILAAGTCSITVTFNPGSTGPRVGTLVVTDTPDSISGSSALSGIGTSCANTAFGSFTLCGSAYNDVSAGTVSVTYYPAAGNGIILHVTYCTTSGGSGCTTAPTQTVTSISDNINSPETCFVASPNSPYNGDSNPSGSPNHDYQRFYEFYCPIIPNGVTTFTVNLSAAAGFLQASPSEWKGIATTGFWENVDNIATSNSVTGLTATVTTSAPTVFNKDLIYAVLNNSGATNAATPGAGYTAIQCNPGPTPGFCSEAMSVTSRGSQTATTTWTTTNRYWFGIIAPLVGVGGTNVSGSNIASGVRIKSGVKIQ